MRNLSLIAPLLALAGAVLLAPCGAAGAAPKQTVLPLPADWKPVEQPDLRQQLDQAPRLNPEDVGLAMKGVDVAGTNLVPNPDGKSWDFLIWYQKGYRNSTRVYVLDMGTGEVKKQSFLAEEGKIRMDQGFCWWGAVGADGKLYGANPDWSRHGSGGCLVLYQYDPGTNAWSVASTFTNARRNFAADIDPATGRIFIVGGYEGVTPGTTPSGDLQIYQRYTNCNFLVGHVTIQGISQPNVRNVEAITLTLCVSGSPVNYTSTLDASGFFTVTTGQPNGTYGWKVKPYKSLSNSGTLTLAGGTLHQEMGTLKGGDANNNNLDNTADFNLLKAAFGTSNNLNTDFNNDNITNTSDFNILKSNFGQSGTGTCP
jgi:hypothetical protein